MTRGERRWYRPAKPREISGGIKSRLTRGASHIHNWWAKRWIETLESRIDPARLSRGRSYARKGQVIEINIEQGLVSARVQGTRKKPYLVMLPFMTADDRAKEMLLFRFRERASFAARLLAGEMPEELENVFAEAGVPLFPPADAVKRYKCTCPDSAIPCKHIVAVLILLAEVLDEDPFLLLKLRGVDKDRLIARLTSASPRGEAADDISDGWERGPEISGGGNGEVLSAPEENEDALPDDASWYGSGGDAPFAGGAERGTAAALDVLANFPFWRGEKPFRQSLVPYYERAALFADEILTGERRRPIGRPKKLI